METGTIAELNLKPGDVVECTFNYMNIWTVGKHYKMTERGLECDFSVPQQSSISTFHLISRASDNPKTWGEMTDAEKGALLLADHEGKDIEVSYKGVDPWEYVFLTEEPIDYRNAYRIKPEPKRETVKSYWCPKWGMRLCNPVHDTTHRITFDLIDDEPDVDSIRMEEI